jgi:hypothetical protein
MKARYEEIRVELDEAGVPIRLVWRGRVFRVLEVQDRWRYAGKWWLGGRGWRRAYWVVSTRCSVDVRGVDASGVKPRGVRTFELFQQGANWVLARESD